MNQDKLMMWVIIIGIFILVSGIAVNKYGPDVICTSKCDNLDMDLSKSFYAQDKYFCECNNEVQHRLVIPMLKGGSTIWLTQNK